MRRRPERSPAPALRGPEPETRTYRFLTPVFGGGVEVKEHKKPHDPITPIRVPSIRGQLRFWWRACNPRRCRTVGALKAAEASVFGSTTEASPLSIAVTEQPRSRRDVRVMDDDKFKNMDGLAYGAFPLRDTTDRRSHGVLHHYTDEWTLSFSYPEGIQADVEAALWAWTHFGGLGGRTRRGFGAIEQVSGPELASVEQGWPIHVGADGQEPWSTLNKDKYVISSGYRPRKSDPPGLAAQEFLLGKLRRLRQGPLGRKIVDRDHKRSFWPEPDAIRRLTRSDPKHSKPDSRVDAFPRAAFGLPIIFHFKDSKDPGDSTLQPAGEKIARLASRLILRPIRQRGEVWAMAVALSQAMPDVELQCPRGEPVRTSITEAEARSLGHGGGVSPLSKDGNIYTDPIQRYLEEIR